MYNTYAIKPKTLFEPLMKASLSCLEMCGNYFMSLDIDLFDALPQLRILNNHTTYFLEMLKEIRF